MIRPISKVTKQPKLPSIRRQYKSIFGLDGGLDLSVPSTAIKENQTPACSEVLFRNHIMSKAKGAQYFSDLNTTPLLGSVMHIDQYYKLNGDDKLIAHTTRNTYAYNTDTNIFECITRGIIVEDCETAWTLQGTATTDVTADRRKGTKSMELTIPDGFVTGIGAYENVSKDISDHTYIHFYIRSSIDLTAIDLDIRISNQASGGTGSNYEDLSIPALVADTWTEVSLEIGTPGNYSSLASVALIVAVDKGACVIDIDDVMAVSEKTANEDNVYTSEIMNNFYINNHKVAPIEYWDMSTATMTTLPVGGVSLGARRIGKLGERVILFHVIAGGDPKPQRVQWTVVGGISTPPVAGDWNNTGSGDVDLEDVMGSDWIMSAEKLGNAYIIYGERTLVLMEYTGKVSAPFSFYTRVTGIGLAAERAIVNLGSEHIFMGWDNIYAYRGGKEVIRIGDNIRDELFDVIAPAYIQRCFMLYIEETDEIRLFYPNADATTCDKYFSYNLKNKAWSRGKRSYTGFGYYSVVEAVTWNTVGDDANATWEEQLATVRWDDASLEALAPLTMYGTTEGKIHQDNETTNNLVGVAIDGYFETKDFVVDQRYRGTITNWMEFSFEARGNGVDISYSLDQGASWSTVVTYNLDAVWTRYRYDFNANSDLIRFRFRNNTLGETWDVREMELGFVPASDRGL